MVKNYDGFDTGIGTLIPERYGRTDRQTDRFAISISRVTVLTCDKNHCGTVSMPKDSSRTRVVTFGTAKYFNIPVKTLIV